MIKGRDGGKAIVATGKLLDKPAEETPVLAEATISVGGRLGTTPDRICRLNQSTIAVTPGQCWQARAAALEHGLASPAGRRP